MAYIDWLLTLIAFLAGPVILLVLLVLRARLRRISRLVQESMADLHHTLNEAIAAHRIIKIFAGQEQEGEKFGNKANANRRAGMKFVCSLGRGHTGHQPDHGDSYWALSCTQPRTMPRPGR